MARLLQLDHLVRAWVVGHRVHVLDGAMVALSLAGRGGVVWLAIGVGLRLARRLTPRHLIELCFAILVSTITTDYIVKPMVNRQRPFTAFHDVEVLGGRPDRASFPSGHTSNAFAAALVLARAVPAWQAVWWTLAALIGYSRIYLGVHYPADVAGGAMLGALLAAVVLAASAALTRSGVKGT